ncbi:MAG: hypothetical protein PHP02_06020 [Eubacteriales bacterium]|nr:hypothetical protein [Eubacteriales bacterium]
MSQQYTSPHGLKSTLSDEVVELASKESPAVFDTLISKAGLIIEKAELFPSFVSVCVFIILSYKNITPYYMIVVYSLLAQFLAGFLSNILFIVNNPVSRPILAIYQILSKFLIHLVAVILVSIFVIGNWMAALIYIAGSFLLSTLLTGIVGNYLQREHFNNKAIISAYRKG